MGTYYNPPEEVTEVGKRVHPGPNGEQPHIPYGHRLVAVMDNLGRKCAPDVTDLDEYQHFYGQYYEGWFVKMDLYLILDGELAHD